jgi:hypothetical protein
MGNVGAEAAFGAEPLTSRDSGVARSDLGPEAVRPSVIFYYRCLFALGGGRGEAHCHAVAGPPVRIGDDPPTMGPELARKAE